MNLKETNAIDINSLIGNVSTGKTVDTKIEEDKINKVEKEIEINDNRLIIGQNEKHNDLYIAEECRLLNTLIIGSKGTGKTTSLLPFYAEQDISKKLAGATFIVNDKEMAYNLYSICKKYKRKVHLLKPSVNNEIANKFLWMEEYNYDYINEHIINYKEIIRRKEIVIIDMEIFKYKLDAIRVISMLLLQLRLDIQETDITQRNKHFLYVDDAFYFIKFLEDLLIYGNTYNLSLTLFLESRNQLKTEDKDYRRIVDDHIRNTLLLNKLNIDDYDYYRRIYPEKVIDNLFGKEKTSIIFQTVDQKGGNRYGLARMKAINDINLEEIEKSAKKIRKALIKENRKNRLNEIRTLNTSINSTYANEPKPIDESFLKLIDDEVEVFEEEGLIDVIDETIVSDAKLVVGAESEEELTETIKNQIIEEEKIKKREVAEKIFNGYSQNIEFCDDLFNFDE